MPSYAVLDVSKSTEINRLRRMQCFSDGSILYPKHFAHALSWCNACGHLWYASFIHFADRDRDLSLGVPRITAHSISAHFILFFLQRVWGTRFATLQVEPVGISRFYN